MHEAVAHELNEADEKILEALASGRNLPQNLANELDYSRQYVQNRLQMLKAADYVENLGGGLYELVDDPRGDGDSDDDLLSQLNDVAADRADLETRVTSLQQRLEDVRAERDRLQERVDELEAQASIDAAALRRALEDVEQAADRGNGPALQDAIRRAREAMDDV